MSILKYLSAGLVALGAMLLIIAQIDRSAYARGKAEAAAACADENTAAYSSQLEEIERLNSATLEAVEEGRREAYAADRELIDAATSLNSAFKELSREPVVPVLPDCRRSYDAVRLYDRAASGPAAGYREVETPAGLSGLGDATLPTPGGPSGN
jgi:hypothetical protein